MYRSFVYILFLSAVFEIKARDSCSRLNEMINLIESHHLKPKNIDSSAHVAILKLYISQIDNNSLLITWDDVEHILAISKSQELCDIMVNSSTRTKTSVKFINHFLEEFNTTGFIDTERPLQFSSFDSLYLSKDKDALLLRWQGWFKYKLINSYLGDQDTLLTSNELLEDFNKARPTLLMKIVERELCKYQNLQAKIQAQPNYLDNLFLEAVSNYYDPHTQFFDMNTLSEFESSLSQSAYSLGLNYYLDDDGRLIISGIQPGGPAWFSGQLHEGDEIKSIEVNDERINDFSCKKVRDVAQLIPGDQPTKAKLEIQKPDGSNFNLELLSTELENEDNLIRSYYLTGEKKIGYLHLPSFYSDFSYLGPSGSADDLSKELLFLMRDGIEGLIIDLRNNGGGSLAEAVSLIGLFVDYGTVGIAESKDGLASIKDLHRGMVYDGPLVILVNKLSASASELFAGALQDYNRAVIVGSTTFGKVSMQQILPLDDATGIKVTYGHFHRLNGTSTQAVGITPDIFIPDRMSAIIPGESEYPYHLTANSIFKKTYARTLPELPIDTLQRLSKIRTDSNKYHNISWQFIHFTKEKLKNNEGSTAFSESHQFWEEWKMMIKKLKMRIDTTNLPYSLGSRHESQRANIENLKTDPQVLEAFYVLNDYLDIKE